MQGQAGSGYTFAPVRVRLAYAACCLLWGSTWLFNKIGLRDLPPLTFAATRMALAAAVLLPFAARAGLRGLRGRELRKIGGVGMLQIGVPYALLFVAQQWVPSGLSAVLFATFPVWLLLLARALLPGQQLTPVKIAAAVLGFAGVAILQAPALRGASLQTGAALGGSLIVAAACLVALANVLVRRVLGGTSPVVLTFVQVLAGSLLLIALAALLERGRAPVWSPRALAAVAWLAVLGTALPFLALFWLLERVPMAAIGAIPLLDTTIAVSLGALVLGEPIGWTLVAGGGLVLTATALANLTGAARLEVTPESG